MGTFFLWAGLAQGRSELTVCADPNNMPFSNQAGQGFENKIVELIARDMHVRLNYLWWAQRRGFVRNTLNASKCDLWPGVPAMLERVAASVPYYRSTYVFVSRADRGLGHLTLDDEKLRKLTIGVQMIGNNASNTPPAHAIARRGLIENVRGYMLYGNYAENNPTDEIVRSVEQGSIDVAIVWGPQAGYFAAQSRIPLRIENVLPSGEGPWPMSFDIAMGVRRGDAALLGEINAALSRKREAIDDILTAYHVPLLPVE